MQRRDRGVAQSLGGSLTKKVKESRVLLVGAGGIGCELLKNLVCCGFGSFNDRRGSTNGSEAQGSEIPAETERTARKPEIVVIDLDTIDLSNLNRQFLFRKHHIKKPKALVAKETVGKFNPSVSIDAHHASIFDTKYDVEFFEGFDLVFNALDNLAARRHVNRMCLAADVPLIESGTTGFNGQVQAIRKGVTECYDCNPKPVQKSFPICTIRSTPSQSIHCIVWAKSYLLPELFGTSEEESEDVAVTEGDNADEVAKLKEEAEGLKNIRSAMGKSEFAREVFNKVFHDDIERLRSMSEMWKTRKPPESLKFEALTDESSIIKQGKATADKDQKSWTLLENISVFCYSLEALSRRSQAGETVIEFDKDDKETLDFVTAASNLRSHIFDIPLQSEWDVKQMAGNIIPAIATSNALTASLCALEAFKIIRSRIDGLSDSMTNNLVLTKTRTGERGDELLGGAKEVFLASRSTERMITSHALIHPKPDCPVCSPVYAKLIIADGVSPTLQSLVDLLKARSGLDEFSITVESVGMIYDPDLTDNLDKSLSEFGVDGLKPDFINIRDDSDEPKVDLLLSAKKQSSGAEGEQKKEELTLVPDKLDLPLKPKQPRVNGETNGEPQSISNNSTISGAKRKRDADEPEGDTPMKRARPDTGEAVEIEEDDGAILLDDD